MTMRKTLIQKIGMEKWARGCEKLNHIVLEPETDLCWSLALWATESLGNWKQSSVGHEN